MTGPGWQTRHDRPDEHGSADFARMVAEAHAGYHDETRRHHEPDALVDDVVTWSMLSPHLMRGALFLVTPTVLLLLWAILSYLSAMSGSDPTAETINSLIALLAVVLYLAGLAALFAPAKEPIAEYSQLLEGRGASAGSAYDWVRRAAEARRTPAEVRPSTVGGVPVLLVTQHSERAMLLVQAYGEDLYVGWTMWRSRSSATMLLHFLRDTFGRFGTGPRFSAELRAASTRALRESVHSLSREGVLAAVHAGDLPRGAGVGPAAARERVPAGGMRTGVAGDRSGAPAAPGRPHADELPPSAPTGYREHDLYAPPPREHHPRVTAREPDPRGDGGHERPDPGWGPPPRE